MSTYNGYRSDSLRLEGWDYRTSAWYFLTICTRDHVCHFGGVRDGIMGLSPAGCIAAEYWARIADLQDRVILDAYVVMPNHIHGLLGLVDIIKDNPNDDVETLQCNVSTSGGEEQSMNVDSLSKRMSSISPKKGSVSAIIRSYKSAVTRTIRRSGCPDFAWQPRFYDRVVRNDREFDAVRAYIQANPVRWSDDKLHPQPRGAP
jgi:REP element-mobilizing transposase RayT